MYFFFTYGKCGNSKKSIVGKNFIFFNLVEDTPKVSDITNI